MPVNTRILTILIVIFFAGALSATAQTAAPSENYQPITGQQRLKWFVKSTIGSQSLTGGLFSAGIGTAMDKPKEYGPHWGGYADRYGMRLTGISTGNAMEAGLGAIWGEDPRYFQSKNRTIKGRIGNAMLMTFLARQRDGSYGPAYARYIATPGNNFQLERRGPADAMGVSRAHGWQRFSGILAGCPEIHFSSQKKVART